MLKIALHLTHYGRCHTRSMACSLEWPLPLKAPLRTSQCLDALMLGCKRRLVYIVLPRIGYDSMYLWLLSRIVYHLTLR